MQIPYGVSNFSDLRRGGFFYVDKTPLLPVLESGKTGYRHLILLRPRRMGKSLLLSMMEHYYDVARADEFDELFGGLWIHEHPTPERNRYLVLTLDFSLVSTDGGEDTLRYSFHEAVKSSIITFLTRYRTLIPELSALHGERKDYQDAAALMANLISIIAGARQKLYVLVDEYDNFANRLLAGGAQDLCETIAQHTGFVRSFYGTMKAGTQNGAIARIFIMGVSPILLDNIASGFNVATHISLHPALNAAVGFTRADVERAVNEFLVGHPEIAGLPVLVDHAALLDVLGRHYDGYRFCADAPQRVWSSDMVLYFLKELAARRRFPDDMLDLNARTDYQHLVRIGALTETGAAARRALLERILSEGHIDARLIKQFGAASLSSDQRTSSSPSSISWAC